ncbi:unnamed protein product [Durusdinium trenchii]|uniref:Uncharacterized protein n=1 Tax=Durusdinium trenchii TaxID=1381693 RepID=A0ABP0MME3_9DINO
MNKVALDIVEEFLELGREVSVTKLMAMFAIIKRRFPARLLPASLRDLLPLDKGHVQNGPRMFWQWLNRQVWRRMLPRHVPFASIYAYSFQLFSQRFLGADPDALSAFWEQNKNSAWFQQHPILSQQGTDLSRCVPLSIHADDSKSHRRRSFCVCTLSSVLVGECSPFDARLLLYMTI